MPVNPGVRHPEPTIAETAVAIARSNGTIVAFVLGSIFGTVITLIGGLN